MYEQWFTQCHHWESHAANRTYAWNESKGQVCLLWSLTSIAGLTRTKVFWDFVGTETKALKMKYDCGDFKRDQQILWYFRHQGYSGLPLAWTINQAAYLLTSKIELKWYSVQVLWKDVTSTCPFLEEHVSRIFGHDFWCPASLKPERTHREVNKV